MGKNALGWFKGGVIVGVVEPISKEDPYWFFNFIDKNKNPVFYIDQDVLMKNFFIEEPYAGINAQWYTAFDYSKITVNSMAAIKEVSESWEGYRQAGTISQLEMPIQKTYINYTQSEKLLNSIMWLFNILVFIILAIYILMISKLIIDYDKDEIALITSRGGGKLHILRGYLLQGLGLGVVALAIGPFLRIFICQVIGSSGAFTEFTNRNIHSLRSSWTIRRPGAVPHVLHRSYPFHWRIQRQLGQNHQHECGGCHTISIGS